MIKTFRGTIADDSIEKINLHTNDGKTGYRITKLQTIPQNVTTTTNEAIIKVYSKVQTSASADIDFTDQSLLAVSFWSNNADTHLQSEDTVTIFDKDIFNQDIYVTLVNVTSSDPLNYYLELEQISLDLNESTVATLQSIRNTLSA
jgi:hypothetical protein